MKIIRDHHHGPGLCQVLRVVFLHGHELVDGVKALLLDSGTPVQLFGGDYLAHLHVHPSGPLVPVSHRISHNFVLAVQKHIVHGPGIHTHAYGNLSQLFTLFHPCLHMAPQLLQIPAQLSSHSFHAIGKPVDLLQRHPALFHPSQNVAAAGSSYVHRKKILFHNVPFLNHLCVYFTLKTAKK